MSYDWIVLQSSDGESSSTLSRLNYEFDFNKVTRIEYSFMLTDDARAYVGNNLFVIQSSVSDPAAFLLRIESDNDPNQIVIMVKGKRYQKNNVNENLLKKNVKHTIVITFDSNSNPTLLYNDTLMAPYDSIRGSNNASANNATYLDFYNVSQKLYSIKLTSSEPWPDLTRTTYLGTTQPSYSTPPPVVAAPPPVVPVTPVASQPTPTPAQPTPVAATSATTCPNGLVSLATAATDLAIKNYQWVWTTYENLRGILFNGANPIGYSQTYFDMSGSPPSLTGKSITALSGIYSGYTTGATDIFYSSIRVLYDDRVQKYIDLISTYAAFIANQSVKDIDARDGNGDPNKTLTDLSNSFPLISAANTDKSQLKPENEYLTYSDTNAATVSTIQGKYGKDLFVFSSPIVGNDKHLEKALSTIKSELSVYIPEYDAVRNATAPSYRPPSATEEIGIPPSNNSTNAQDLIDVMNEYMNKSTRLVRGGKRKGVQDAIDAYKKLYTDYQSYLTDEEKDTIGVDSFSYRELYDDAPDVNTLEENETKPIEDRYKNARGSEPQITKSNEGVVTSYVDGTGLNSVIVDRLRDLCDTQLTAFKKIFEDFAPLLEIPITAPYPSDLSGSLKHVYNPIYLTSQGSKINLVNILNYYRYPAVQDNVTRGPTHMTNFLKNQLTSKLNDISGVLVRNAATLEIPLSGVNVLKPGIVGLAATLATDFITISGKTATVEDVGNVDTTQDNSLYDLAQKYLTPTTGIRDILASEIKRLTDLDNERKPTKSQLELFYDSCYTPFKDRLAIKNFYTLPTIMPITDYILPASLNKTPRDLNTDMTRETFYALDISGLKGVYNTYDFAIETVKTKILECVKSDLAVYKDLYNAYNKFRNDYSNTFSQQSSDLAGNSFTVLEIVDQPSSYWNIDPTTKRIIGESVDFLEFNEIASAPGPTPGPTSATNPVASLVEYMKRVWMSHFVKDNSQSSYMYRLITSIKSQFSTFLTRFDAISDEATGRSYTITFQDGDRKFAVALRYKQYETDSGKLLSIQSDSVDKSDIARYNDCMKYNNIFMKSTTETIDNTLVLPIGLIPRYALLVPMFCLDDDRRRAIAALKEFWDKYTTLRINSIPFLTIPTGVTNLLTFFTNGELNTNFTSKKENEIEQLQTEYRNPDNFIQPLNDTKYFTNLKESTATAVTPLVNLFLDGILEKYRIFEGNANEWELDIAYIFYTKVQSGGKTTFTSPRLSLAAICEGIYQDPPRYLRLLDKYQSINTLWELAKYRKCIPIDIQNRSSKDVLKSWFAR